MMRRRRACVVKKMPGLVGCWYKGCGRRKTHVYTCSLARVHARTHAHASKRVPFPGCGQAPEGRSLGVLQDHAGAIVGRQDECCAGSAAATNGQQRQEKQWSKHADDVREGNAHGACVCCSAAVQDSGTSVVRVGYWVCGCVVGIATPYARHTQLLVWCLRAQTDACASARPCATPCMWP